MMFRIDHLTIARNGKNILSDISFAVDAGECVVVRGKNGAGKSSLFAAIMGLSDVQMVSGDIFLEDQSCKAEKTFERARAGMFLAHQEPPVLEGVSLSFMARASLEAICGIADVPQAQRRIREAAQAIGIVDDFLQKILHADMSGGEKKRAELFLLALLQPKVAFLDEIDSGVDVETREMMVHVISQLRSSGTAFVVITHTEAFAEALGPTAILAI